VLDSWFQIFNDFKENIGTSIQIKLELLIVALNERKGATKVK